MTEQGQGLIRRWYADFSATWAEKHPGCNQNDCERAFLWTVLNNLDKEGMVTAQEARDGVRIINTIA